MKIEKGQKYKTKNSGIVTVVGDVKEPWQGSAYVTVEQILDNGATARWDELTTNFVAHVP